MLKVVIVDDNTQVLDDVYNIVNKVMLPLETEYRIEKYKGFTKEVKEIVEDTTDEKIYILDIELPTISGIEIASRIREKDWRSVIIFLTAHNECKNDVFTERLMVLDYVSKLSECNQRLRVDVTKALNILNKQRIFVAKFNNVSYRIKYEDILYVETEVSKRCQIFLESGRTILVQTSLKKMMENLGQGFVQCHKCCIVNVEKIRNIDFSSNVVEFTNGLCAQILSCRKRKVLDEYIRNNKQCNR